MTTNYSGTNGYLKTNNSTSTSVLKVEAGDDKYNKVTITIDDTFYLATISFTGKSSKNKIRFHPSGASSFFSCYSSSDGQQPIYLYRAVTAKEWATDFLATTATPCESQSKTELEAVWESTKTEFNLLIDADKATLKSATYTTADVGEAVERYDYILNKYASSSETISDYIGRSTSSSNKSMLWVDTTTIIISVIALTGVSAVAVYLFVKKFKHK